MASAPAPGKRPPPPSTDTATVTALLPRTERDPMGWARTVWNERDAWLHSAGGVQSVFMAAQLLGLRDEAVAWLRSRTRL